MCLFPLVQPWKASHCLEGWLLLLLFSCPVVSDPLWSHGLQYIRLLCPPLFPRFSSISCPLSQWCFLTISFFATLFRYIQSFPGSFPMSQPFASGGQSTGASASTSVLPMNIQDWFPLGLSGLISLQSRGLSSIFSSTTIQKHQFFCAQPSLWFNSHIPEWLLTKNISLTIQTSVSKVMSLLFNTLSRFATAFLPRSKCLLISWLQSPPTVISRPPK